MRQSLPDKLWLDIFSKSDLLSAHFQKANALRQRDAGVALPSQLLPSSSTPHVGAQPESVEDDASAVNGQWVSEAGSTTSHNLQAETRSHTRFSLPDDRENDNTSQDETEHAIAQQSGESHISTPLREEQEDWNGAMDPANSMQEALEAALMLPAALRISAVTQEGIETLQLATMQLLSNPASSSVQQEPAP